MKSERHVEWNDVDPTRSGSANAACVPAKTSTLAAGRQSDNAPRSDGSHARRITDTHRPELFFSLSLASGLTSTCTRSWLHGHTRVPTFLMPFRFPPVGMRRQREGI